MSALVSLILSHTDTAAAPKPPPTNAPPTAPQPEPQPEFLLQPSLQQRSLSATTTVPSPDFNSITSVSYTHLRAHETG